MKKLFLNILSIPCVATTLFSICSCGSNTTTCDVTIDLDGGKLNGQSGRITITVDIGSTYESLGIPTKPNFKFAGWELDGKIVNLSDTIEQPVTIKAKWESVVINKKTASFYTCDNTSISYKKASGLLDTYFINDSQIPYVTIQDLFASAFQSKPERYAIYHPSSLQFDVHNIMSSQLQTEGVRCNFDIAKQRITFSEYDRFTCYSPDIAEDPLSQGCLGGYWCKSKKSEYTIGDSITIDLTKYNIPIYCDDNYAYIPYYFCSNIFKLNTLGYPSGSAFTFVRNNYYEICNDCTDKNGKTVGECKPSLFNKKIRELEKIPSDEQIFNIEYREFCYNLLALTLDINFGMFERKSRVNPDQTVKYFENSALEALKPYHDKFVSFETDVSNDALVDFMKNECDDGGHSAYTGCDIFSVKSRKWVDFTGKEYKHVFEANTNMKQTRNLWSDYPFDSNHDSEIEIESSDGQKKDIAWVTFDEFSSSATKPLYNDITKETYMWKKTIGMTMYLQKIVNEDLLGDEADIDKIVIDLSCNGGGTISAERVLASYLCGRENTWDPCDDDLGKGGATATIFNPHTNAFSKTTYYADINEDGLYNEKDYLPQGVQVYCIVSDGSFSAANELAFLLKTCSNCKFIGSKSAGGACSILPNMNIGLGNVIQISSHYHGLQNGSTSTQYASIDDGVYGDHYHIPFKWDNYMDFFDREEIIKNHLN